jgi:CheY-like chemotaxis protein
MAIANSSFREDFVNSLWRGEPAADKFNMKHVMVVDDSADTLLLAQRTLQAAGFEVTTASSLGKAALALAARPVDLLVIDVILPEGNGLDFLEQLKKTSLSETPVIILSGKKGTQDIAKALKLGAYDYICKPFDRDIFLSKVEAVLGVPEESKPITFASTSPNFQAVLEISCQIVSGTETGITLHASTEIGVGCLVQVNSNFFSEIGIAPVGLRVSKVERLAGPRVMFEISLNFVGLDEEAMKKVRAWVLHRNAQLSAQTQA